MFLTKFRINWPFGSGEEAKNRFSRWPPWRPSWISDWNDFSSFFSTSHPNASYQVSSQLAFRFRRTSEKYVSIWPPWRPSWIFDRNGFSYFSFTSHPDASYQVSSQLAQGCRRNGLLNQLLTPHDRRRMTTIAHLEHFVLR